MNEIDKLIDFIKESNHIVFFGGAGVSTESGVPDFRSKDGLYNQHDIKFDMYQPEYLLSHDCLVLKPEVFYEFYRQKMDARHVEPNITHKVLAKLEEAGKLSAVVTQNIDGLHQKAGSRNGQELHGSVQRNTCQGCHTHYDLDFILDEKNCKNGVPICPKCGSVIKPDVVLYGECLDELTMHLSIKAIEECDMLIIGGTSLVVLLVEMGMVLSVSRNSRIKKK